MIINLIINLILLVFGSLFVFFPVVHLSDLPFGEQIVSVLTQIMGIWNAFVSTFPYAEIGFQVFLYVIIPFEILLIIAKFFLGSRLPANHSK